MTKIMKIFGLDKIDKIVSLIEEFVVSACMIMMAAALLVTLVFRLLNITIVGGEEVAEFAIIWMTFLGLALCARRGINISMSFFLDKMPANTKNIMTILICLITGICCLYLAVLGIQLTSAVFTRGQITPALRIPIGYFYMAAPIGFTLSGIYYLANVANGMKTKKMMVNMRSGENE